MSQANVYTSATGQAWYTDKARITAGANVVTYQVEAVQLTYVTPNGNVVNVGTPVGNIYSNAVSISANAAREIYVGVGNKLTVVGTPVTIEELGTASSATKGVNGAGSS